MLFYLTQALFQRWAGYTGTSLYESWSLSMFNTLFTSLPVIFMGIFEKDLTASTLLAVPELYSHGQKNRGFNFKVYLWWMFMAASEAMVVFFCMLGIYGYASFTTDNSLFSLGDLTFVACVVIIWAKMQAIEMHSKSWPSLISLICCPGGFFLWNLILSCVYTNNVIYKVKDNFIFGFGRSFLWWFTVILIISAVILYELVVKSLQAAYFPTDVDIFQEFERDISIKRRFEEAAAIELQQGWDRGKKKSSLEINREAVELAEQAAREGQVQELLKNRPDELMRENSKGGGSDTNENGNGNVNAAGKSRRSMEIQEMLSRRFGSIRRE
jgi:phospholipid-translocating ATPase